MSRAALTLVRSVACEGPTILAIDDVQWLDPSSANVLEFIARRIGDLPVGVVVTQRARGAALPLGLGSAFERPPAIVVVEPLAAGDIDRLLRARLGLSIPRPRLLELTRISGGNPPYALEIARAVPDPSGWTGVDPLSVPDGLALVRCRLAGLPPEAEDAVLLAAAAAHPTAEFIERVTGRTGPPCGTCSPRPPSSAAGCTGTVALDAVARFADAFAEWPKATGRVTGELDVLLAFPDCPSEHHIHLRTSNPIESTFSTVRLRTRVTKGAGSRAAGLAMAYKLVRAAEDRWRKVNAPHLVALVRAGAVFIDGRPQERSLPPSDTEPVIDEESAAA